MSAAAIFEESIADIFCKLGIFSPTDNVSNNINAFGENPKILNNSCVKKEKVRTRRRHRKKKNSKLVQDVVVDVNVNEGVTADDPDEVDDIINFSLMSIQAVRSQKNGMAIRKRNAKCQFINVNSFTNSTKPYIHISEKCKKLVVDKNIKSNEFICEAYNKAEPKNGIVKKSHRYCSNNDKHTNLQSSTSEGRPKRRQRKHVYSNSKDKSKGALFQDYLDIEEVNNGLLSGDLIKGVIRINAKNASNAYVNNADRNSQDYLINSVVDRNRAFEGDVVVLKIKPESQWHDGQKTACIMYIYEKVHPRTAIGSLSVQFYKNQKIGALLPRDKRLPRISIPQTSLPPAFFSNPADYENVLYMAKITKWNQPKLATGVIIDRVGLCNELQAETKALLLENQLTIEPFPESVYKYLPTSSEIPPKEFEYREDLRKDCVFTIDPLTARDLDDAVSCKLLPNGNLEIGVHIADVTFHLNESTELDKIVAKKATTIYLVDNVYHMLPVELCMHCSLLPGKDTLAFSVFWEMTEDGEIVNYRFARTVINSCCQLAYEHVQRMMDSTEEIDSDSLPNIHNGYDIKHIREVVKNLQHIAANLRQKRFDNGALRIDQVKVCFRLNVNGEPLEQFIYETTESHRLIEEFMLLANITVAQKIYNDFPDMAFLRCHEPPNPRLIKEVQQILETVGLHIDTSSSASLNSSLQKYSTTDYLGSTRNAVLNHLLAKPMTRARYFCSSDTSIETNNHYALSVPIYTHFTSPIRRYADIMVHRLLAASLGYQEKPNWDLDYVREIAENCNKQKYNAKRAGEASTDLFLVHYIENNQPFIQDAVVVDVKERSFDILILNTGSMVRMFANNLGDGIETESEKFGDTKKMWRLSILYPENENGQKFTQIIEMFQIIKVNLKRKGKSNSLEGEIIRPDLLQQ